jgi:hypothetical protein
MEQLSSTMAYLCDGNADWWHCVADGVGLHNGVGIMTVLRDIAGMQRQQHHGVQEQPSKPCSCP